MSDDHWGGADPYESDVHRWWHLSKASPELIEALADGWLPPRGRALDLGCGLGEEIGFLARRGMLAVGVDLSGPALVWARARHPEGRFVEADLRALPFRTLSFDVLLDRGCFHYLDPSDRPRYEAEAARVLAPNGRFLLRASLRAAGIRNDIDEEVIRATFGQWHIDHLVVTTIPSDTRELEVILARLRKVK